MLARLFHAVPIMSAMLSRHWDRLGHTELQASPPDSRIDKIFADFGTSVLTNREREVTQLILRGHSSESIDPHLDISVGTVRTHRGKAYAELGITSQSELLSLLLTPLKAD